MGGALLGTDFKVALAHKVSKQRVACKAMGFSAIGAAQHSTARSGLVRLGQASKAAQSAWGSLVHSRSRVPGLLAGD